MDTKDVSISKLGFISGFLTAGALIVYFLLMKVLGLAHITELRVLNLVILLGGLILTYNYFRSNTKTKVNYLPGLGLGFLSCGVTVITFSAFLFVYFSAIDPVLLAEIKERNAHTGYYLTPFTAAFTIACEGIGTGAMITFALMQFFKGDFLQRTVNEEGIRA